MAEMDMGVVVQAPDNPVPSLLATAISAHANAQAPGLTTPAAVQHALNLDQTAWLRSHLQIAMAPANWTYDDLKAHKERGKQLLNILNSRVNTADRLHEVPARQAQNACRQGASNLVAALLREVGAWILEADKAR